MAPRRTRLSGDVAMLENEVTEPPTLPVTALRADRHLPSCLTIMSNHKHRIDSACASRRYQRGSLERPRSLKYLLRGANSCRR
jgi:hypothetical protein